MTATETAVAAAPERSFSGRLPALDGLRGIAAALVVLSHTSIAVIPGGFVGVDLFFVLSGFLITGLLLDEYRREGRISLAHFWARRATRLLPAAMVVVVAVVITSMLLDDYSTRVATIGDSVAGALYIENWHLILQGNDYFGESLAPSRLQHYWSLAVEEQFYLVWPLLIIALMRRSRWAARRRIRPARIIVPIALLGAFSYLYAVLADNGTGTVAYMGTFARVWQLLLGAGLAVAWRVSTTWIQGRRADVLTAVGAVALAFVALYSTAARYLPFGALLAGAAGGILVVGLIQAGPVGMRVFCTPVLQWLGKVSYALYLWHWPVIVFSEEIVGDSVPAWMLTFWEIGLTTLLAWGSYHLVENPVRHLKIRDLRPKLVCFGAIAASLLLAVSIAAWGDHQKAAVAATVGVDLADASADGSVTACPDQPTPCVRHEGTSGFTVATVGDSTMQAYDPALEKLAKEKNFTYVQAAVGGCPVGHRLLATGLDGQLHKPSNFNCFKWFPDTYDTLLNTYDPDVILVTSSNERSQYVDGAGNLIKTNTEAHKQGTADALQDAFTQLASKGAKIVTIDQLPRGKGVDCLADAATASDCDTQVDADDLAKTYNALERDVAKQTPKAQSITVTDVVCPDGTCTAVQDGVVVRYDGGHFTRTYSERLATPLARALASVGISLSGR